MREMKDDRIKTDGIKHRCSIKVLAFVVMILSAVIFFGSILSARLMWSHGVFSSSREEVEAELGEDLTQTSGEIILSNYISGSTDYVEIYCGEIYSLEFEAISGIASYKSEGIDGNSALVPYEQTYVWGSFIDWASLEVVPYYGEALESTEEGSYYTLTSDSEQVTKLLSGILFTEEEIEAFEQKQYLDYEIETIIYVDQTYPVMDVYYVQGTVISFAYTVAPFIWYIIGFSFILCCVLFIFLLISAGYRKGENKRILCGTARIPYELYLAIVGSIGLVGCAILADAYYDLFYGYLGIALYGLMGMIVLVGSVTLFLMDLVVRVSTGTLMSNLIIVKLWKWLNPIRRSKRSIKGVFKFFGKIMGEIPTIWKGILLYLGVSFLGLIMILPYWFGMRFFIWIFANALMLPMFIYVCIMLKRLQLASKSLGEGDLSYEVDTKYSIFEFKEMGESLNSIAAGMECAVEEKMKSERMKTELISNVSHDIKTPLTSIVNYADLISKEETHNPKIHEYSEILLRQ
ncbi:MAG: histidine kinase dimerization/phospho-acceptor domain-containing protein, partial [Eubacteriales bacterium]